MKVSLCTALPLADNENVKAFVRPEPAEVILQPPGTTPDSIPSGNVLYKTFIPIEIRNSEHAKSVHY